MTAKAQMKKRRDRFVVGYLGTKNIVFGIDNAKKEEQFVFSDACEPLTKLQAMRLLRTMPCPKAAIFELVPVKINR